MKTYLVGGAVRDELLGRPARERDYVVVGSTEAELLALGYRRIGRHFPVFLHPDTGDQHALARTERKTGPGHRGFAVSASPEVALEEDLSRRDLTINAIARTPEGSRLIDPYNGQRDLADKLLRHVSPAFVEDPLRVFRVARFAAELPGFRVHRATLAMMSTMQESLADLAGERVWQELRRAMQGPLPHRFFEVLRDIGGTCWFDKLDLAATVDLYARRFPTAGDHDGSIALAALGWCNDAASIAATCERLRAPRLVRTGAVATARFGRAIAAASATEAAADDAGAAAAEPAALLAALQGIGAFRQGALAGLVLDAVAACAGDGHADARPLAAELAGIKVDEPPGPGYGEALKTRRLAGVEAWLRTMRRAPGPARSSASGRAS